MLDRKRYRQGERTTHSTGHEWLWVTTLPQQAFAASVIRQLGHSRWKNENNGWMDLTKHWPFKHGSLHACRHRPQQTNTSGDRKPVSNHGLAAVTLILLIAFSLSSAFVLRHSKLARRDHLTAIAVAAQLRASARNSGCAWLLQTTADPTRAPSGSHTPEDQSNLLFFGLAKGLADNWLTKTPADGHLTNRPAGSQPRCESPGPYRIQSL